MGLPGCLFVCHLILLLVCFLFNWSRWRFLQLKTDIYGPKSVSIVGLSICRFFTETNSLWSYNFIGIFVYVVLQRVQKVQRLQSRIKQKKMKIRLR